MAKIKKTRFQLVISPDIKAAAKAEAELRGLSLSAYVTETLRNRLTRLKYNDSHLLSK